MELKHTINSVRAVARNTVRQAIRVRIAFAIMAIYLILVPLLPFILKGDGTLRGLLHVVISYSLMMAGALLGLLTLALSTTTLWSELREKQIYLIESRPVHRWEVLLGKLVGILSIDVALLAFMALVTWGCVQYIVNLPRWTRNDRDTREDRARAFQQVLTARRVVDAEKPQIDEGINDYYRKLEAGGKLPTGKTEAEIKDELRKGLLRVINALPRYRWRVWRFPDLPTSLGPKATVTLRYKFSCSERSEEPVRTLWHIGKFRSPDAIEYAALHKADEQHEDVIPASAIAEDGVLEVHCGNGDPRYLIIVFNEGAVQVLVPVAGFLSNLLRGLTLIFIEVLFLAILGLFCSTFMGFPVSPVVAVCILLFIYLAGIANAEHLKDIPLRGDESVRKLPVSERAVVQLTAAIRFVLPPLDSYSPSSMVSSGEEVSWLLLLEAFAEIALLRGGILFLLGAVIFQHREIAGASR